ncbi:HAMP domain-containing sensor histidine kinase [Eubacterium sp. 1001713B170207_170306_E7]|uniref:sensor histidine kinase n=1 Tax=Eubacterium sp. 1001713B170207_170306_E7 TaxID=2787097 RepID=UPI001899D8FD|nr:HAMP domain-containing sensor histidine kinase [Eubacterium sp. 1001713B170207_170306_E7]
MKKLKLFPKTFLFTLSLMLVITLVAYALLYFLLPGVYTRVKEQNLHRATDALATALEKASPDNYNALISDFISKNNATVTLAGNGVVYSNGITYSTLTDEDTVSQSAPGVEADTQGSTGQYAVSPAADALIIPDLSVLVPMLQDGALVSEGISTQRDIQAADGSLYQLSITATLQPVGEASSIILMLLPVALLICLAIAAVFALFYSRALTRPIKEISAVTARMQTLDPDARCAVTSGDEIGALSQNLNSLYASLLSSIHELENEIAKVSAAEQSKVDFMRTASHELKTPVTAVSGMLEGMICGVGRYRDRDTYLQVCREQIDELSVLIREILDATRLDLLVENQTPAETDLAALVDRVAAPYQLIARASGVRLTLDTTGSFTARVPAPLLEKALSNVLSNAVRYTPAGQNARLRFERRSLVIENECPPVSREHLPHLKEAFYRPEFSHSHDNGGNGLGLYLTDRILSGCGLPYTFEPMKNPEGMRFTIHFP